MPGFASAIEGGGDTITLDEWLLENREASYIIKVRSSAFQESGILSGDTLIVERGRTPRKNDIVVVESEGAYGLRYFSDVWPNDAVVAVVTAVIRKYV